jgi:hypothetical protein
MSGDAAILLTIAEHVYAVTSRYSARWCRGYAAAFGATVGATWPGPASG